jgi:hypothetical protein
MITNAEGACMGMMVTKDITANWKIKNTISTLITQVTMATTRITTGDKFLLSYTAEMSNFKLL